MSAVDRIAATVEELCSLETAGRSPGSAEGEAARRIILRAFDDLDLRPAGEVGFAQAIPEAGGVNVLGAIPGSAPGWVVLGAHYDHLGIGPEGVYWGANDNASGMAVMLEAARILADGDPRGRSVLVSAYDAEEPPWFQGPWMGSQWWVDHPTIPLEEVDLMVCLDTVGHRLGDDDTPADIGDTVLRLGTDLVDGLAAMLTGLPPVPGIIPREIADWVLPPLSDHLAFRNVGIPFLFYTCARSTHYHTTDDRPEHLDTRKMAALADHIALVVGEARRARVGSWAFDPSRSDDGTTLDTLLHLAGAAPGLNTRDQAVALVEDMRTSLQDGRATVRDRERIRTLLLAAESMLG